MALTPAGTGEPCAPWVTAEQLPAECTTDVDPVIVAGCIGTATTLLWAFSGRRFGQSCAITIRPPSTCEGTWRGLPLPGLDPVAAGLVRDYSWTWHHRGKLITLDGPLYSVDTVLVDGVELTEGIDYVVEDHATLRRIGTVWPRRNNLDLDDTEEGTWSITYTVGQAIPAAGLYAAQVLACEFIKARVNAAACRLPRKVRTVSRQGVTIDVNNLSEYLVDGRLGIDEVDAFLVAVNPHALPSRSTVMSPDIRRGHRR